MIAILTVKEAAASRGVKTQTELLELIEDETGVKMRPSTLSAIYRNSQTTINREHLTTIMQALNINDFNEVLTLGYK